MTSLSGTAYTYDANGNLTADGVRTYAWDAEDRLVTIGYTAQAGRLTTFAYDGLSRRISKSSKPNTAGAAVLTKYIWCGQALCQSRSAAGAVTRRYLAEGEYVPGTTPIRYYYATDQIGSVRRVFASNNTTPAYAYDPYGAPLQSTAPVTERGYAGMLRDPDSGLSMTLYRAYNPLTGRWLSRDPVGEAPDPGGNLYAYVGGDAVNLNDPLGLCPGRGGQPQQTSACPSSSGTVRGPDFVSLSGSVPIPNPVTLIFAGVGVSLTADRYGNSYASLNGVVGFPSALGASLMAGWINSAQKPSQQTLAGTLSGWGVGGSGGYIGGVGEYGNASGSATSVGLHTQGAGAYAGWTWKLPFNTPSWCM